MDSNFIDVYRKLKLSPKFFDFINFKDEEDRHFETIYFTEEISPKNTRYTTNYDQNHIVFSKIKEHRQGHYFSCKFCG